MVVVVETIWYACRFEPLPAELPRVAQLVERSPRVLWVRIPPRAALYFSLKKRAVLGVVDLFVVPLPFYLIVFTCVPSFTSMRATVGKFEE